MEVKVPYGLLALVACAAAASISGQASLDPSQVSVGGQITFPRIPGINAPLLGSGGSSGNSTNNRNNTGSPFDFLSPFLGLLNHANHNHGLFLTFPNLADLISRIPRNSNNTSNGNSTRNGNTTVILPAILIPGLNQGYIPGVSEALGKARQHLQAALNISSDLSTGLTNAVQVALNSDNPVGSVGVILDTIAKVYTTIALNCPLIIVGARVFNEGVRLAGEVVRSIANVAVGPQNNNVVIYG